MPSTEEWSKRWVDKDTPWNHAGADAPLFQNYERLRTTYGFSEDSSVLVPLCGDSRSIRFFFERGHSVTGVEFAPEAIERLFREQFPENKVVVRQQGAFLEHSIPRVRILQGDLFALTEREAFAVIYDRAALVAIEPAQRRSYAALLEESLAPGGVLYANTFEYQEGPQPHPPFSVPRSEVIDLFSRCFPEELEEKEIADAPEYMTSYSNAAPRLLQAVLRKR